VSANFGDNGSMRIIAGMHRGRPLLPPPPGRDGPGLTRPITDRVKEALFNSLMARDVTGRGVVLDIFAGTGSLGLEALSRGADFCTFVEDDRKARDLLAQNLRAMGLEAQAQVLGVDALATHWLAALVRPRVLLAFCDPPYRLMIDPAGTARVGRLLQSLAPRIEPDGLLVLRTPRETASPAIEGFLPAQTRLYGTQALHLYEPADGGDGSTDAL
jgi:16S rRNA (guanine966-N2)-methyltransferase